MWSYSINACMYVLTYVRHCHSQHCSEDEGECEGVPVQQVSPRLHSGGWYTAVLCHPPATEVRPSLCWHFVNSHTISLCQLSCTFMTLCQLLLFWQFVNCRCSDTLSTVTCSDSLQATELLFLHSICQVSSCTWASKIACLFRHFSTVTCLSVCQLYPSLSLSAVISHCHCLQLPVPYPSHPRPHCLSLLVSSCAVLQLLHVPNVRTYVRTHSQISQFQYCGHMTVAVSNIYSWDWNSEYCMSVFAPSLKLCRRGWGLWDTPTTQNGTSRPVQWW